MGKGMPVVALRMATKTLSPAHVVHLPTLSPTQEISQLTPHVPHVWKSLPTEPARELFPNESLKFVMACSL